MFCERCGGSVNPGEKFCQSCGAPVPQQESAQQPVQQYQPVQQPARQYQQTAGQYQQPAQPYTQQYPPYQQQPEQPKKKMSKGVKTAIICSSIGAVVIAAGLVALFVFILPMMNRIDPSQYITMTFDTDTVYDGSISGDICFDFDKLKKDKNWSDSDLIKLEAAKTVMNSLELSCSKKGSDEEASKNNHHVEFRKAAKDDVYVVTIAWPASSSDKSIIDAATSYAGIGFDESAKTVELKVGDYATERGIEVKDLIEIDFLGHVKEHPEMIVTSGSDKDMSVYVEEFSMTMGDYLLEKDSKYDSYIKVFDSSEELIGEFYVELMQTQPRLTQQR